MHNLDPRTFEKLVGLVVKTVCNLPIQHPDTQHSCYHLCKISSMASLKIDFPPAEIY